MNSYLKKLNGIDNAGIIVYNGYIVLCTAIKEGEEWREYMESRSKLIVMF